jgi:hypothetical protein
LCLNAGSETWESIISLIAYAPMVSVGTVAVDDENGQLDPGDTAAPPSLTSVTIRSAVSPGSS